MTNFFHHYILQWLFFNISSSQPFVFVPLLVNFDSMEKIRQIIFYNHYFEDFFNKQTDKVKNKIDEVLYLITIIDRVPKKFLQYMAGTDGLYEIRIELGGNIYRIFCCFDEGMLVVLFNGFQKKTQKTPKTAIEKALILKAEYFNKKLKL